MKGKFMFFGSVTFFVTIAVWISGAMIEHLVRANWLWFDRMMTPKIDRETGEQKRSMFRILFMLASAFMIGVVLQYIAGPTVGTGAALGQLIGLATNDYTHKLFTEIFPRWNARRKRVIDAVSTATNFWANCFRRYPRAAAAAWGSVKLGCMAIAAIVAFILGIIGLPFLGFQELKKRKHIVTDRLARYRNRKMATT